MKLLLMFSCAAMLAVAADAPRAKRPASAPAIPANAVQTAPGTYRYTDVAGKVWWYRQTPFGVARVPDQPEPRRDTTVDGTRAREEGDTIVFERPGPFGVYHWSTKKSALSESERAVWERERTRAGAQE
jgi:hypothetical protein